MTDLRSDIVFSMPWAMIQHLPFREQVEATRLAGFQELSLHPFVVGQSVGRGLSLLEMKTILAGEGIRVGRIDPLAAWMPEWRAHNFGLDLNLATATDAAIIFDLANHFEAPHVSLNAMWHRDRYSTNELVDGYAAICARAAPHGLTCDIEPIPMWGIPTLEDALQIIDLASVGNGGIVLDFTHLCRGETPLDVLASVPGTLITAVQICDGLMPKPAALTLEEECLNRQWPGEGGFPIENILSVLHDIGGLNGVGPEVFSPVYARDAVSCAAIAAQSRASMLRYAQLTDGFQHGAPEPGTAHRAAETMPG